MYQSGGCFRGVGGAARRVASSASSSARTSPSVQLWWGSRALGHRSSTRSKPLRGGKSREEEGDQMRRTPAEGRGRDYIAAVPVAGAAAQWSVAQCSGLRVVCVGFVKYASTETGTEPKRQERSRVCFKGVFGTASAPASRAAPAEAVRNGRRRNGSAGGAPDSLNLRSRKNGLPAAPPPPPPPPSHPSPCYDRWVVTSNSQQSLGVELTNRVVVFFILGGQIGFSGEDKSDHDGRITDPGTLTNASSSFVEW
nr:unnamed protein product [Digitaria exilis]